MACNSGGTDQLNWIKQSKEFGMMDLMAVHVPLTSMYTAMPAGPSVYAGLICGTDYYYDMPANYPGYDAAKKFREKYEKRWKAPPDPYGSNPYVSVMEWAKAVNKAGSLNPDEIRKALVQSEFQYYKTPEYWRPCDLQGVQDWFLVKGKTPQDSKNQYDLFEVIGWGGRENSDNYLPPCAELGYKS
jgi:branched-chain amino acid transport system substrate-binding protein